MLTLLLAMLLALGVSFVCSFIEAALLSLTPANIAEIANEDPATGKIWMGFKTDIGRPISVILLLNTTAHTIGASVAGAKWSDLFGSGYLWLFSLVFTFLMLQYTEILPKTLGVRFRRSFAANGAKPLVWAIRVLSPAISLIRFINRPFEVNAGEAAPDTISEIDSLAAMARMSNLIGSRQEKIISSATHLKGIDARQVMIPLDQVTILSTANTIHEAFLVAHMDLHTRYPVRDAGDSSRLLGYVNFKELVYFMSTNPANPSLTGIIRPLNFISPDTNASDLLKLFVDQHKHMVVVREEDGECLGIVTVEDVIEELVGEIEDEFDRLPNFVHSLAGGVWLVGGGAPLRELSRVVGEELGQGGAVADWLAEALGREFKPGDRVVRGGFEIAVRRIKRGRIFEAAVSEPLVPGKP